MRCDGETSRPLRFRCRLRHANTYVWWGPQTYVNVGFWFYPKKSEFQTFVDVRCIYHHRNHLVINQPVATEAQLAEIPGVGLKKPTVQPMTRPGLALFESHGDTRRSTGWSSLSLTHGLCGILLPVLGAQATSPKESHGSQEEGGGAELGRREIDLFLEYKKQMLDLIMV